MKWRTCLLLLLFSVRAEAMLDISRYQSPCNAQSLGSPPKREDAKYRERATVLSSQGFNSALVVALKRENGAVSYHVAVRLLKDGRQQEYDEFMDEIIQISLEKGETRAGVLLAERTLDSSISGSDTSSSSALKFLSCAYEFGSPYAAAVLANHYLFVTKTNIEYGVKALEFAAESGQMLAMVQLSMLLADGRYVKKDLVRRYNLLKRAAMAGSFEMAVNLGVALENGEGTPPDPHEALKWYLFASNHNDPYGSYYAGMLLARQGRISEAEAYLQKAADGGMAEARNALSKLPKRTQ